MKNNTFSKVYKFAFILAAIFVFSAYTVSAQKASYVGTWNLNQEKSQMGEGPGRRGATKIVITESDGNMVVERTSTRQSGETMTTTEKYNLAGTETDNTNGTRKKKSVASWSADNQELTVKSTTTMERDGNTMETKSTEVYKLSADKKNLTIDSASSSSFGEFKTTLVYDRAQ